MDTIGRQQNTTIITESRLYSIILLSRKPEAKKFKRWVTHEVLPSIRKHGVYMTEEKFQEFMCNPDAWIKVLTALKNERSAKEQLQAQINKDKPKVLFADTVSVSDTTILIGELAKILKGNGINIGQNRMFEWMRQNGYLIKRKGTDRKLDDDQRQDMLAVGFEVIPFDKVKDNSYILVASMYAVAVPIREIADTLDRYQRIVDGASIVVENSSQVEAEQISIEPFKKIISIFNKKLTEC